MDVKSDFLNGYLNEEVYVEQPKGFIDPVYSDHVFKLQKVLYGLKQAPRAWYERLTELLLQNGYIREVVDRALFVKKSKGSMVIAQVYVDDIVFGGMLWELVDLLVKQIQQEFEMSMVGVLTYFLGFENKKMRDGIFISQNKYTKAIVKKFGLEKASAKRTPTPTHIGLTRDSDGTNVYENLYQNMIGSLLYLIASNPDIQ